MFSIAERDLENQATQRDDPPRCGNCVQMERKIKKLEDQLDEIEAYAIACHKHPGGGE